MNDYLMRPDALPTWRQRTALRLLNLIGWQFHFKPLPGPHGIAVVYPHTSNIDFPVSAPQGAIKRLAQTMHASTWFWLAVTPEGTRSYRPYWKSGFYRIAREADVPVALIAIDYGRKIIDVTRTMTLTGDEAADMAAIAARYEGVRGRFPKDMAPIRLAPHPPAGGADNAS
ncbi:MAG: glycerol acyltransferase [Oxalobacteraceae bacterium]|nr:MAG: glycerol acyltransferase [Oxalobacteraceae bacterium]